MICKLDSNAKIRNFESRDRSFRGFNKLNESLATWNLFNTLAIVQKKNLSPSLWGSSWTLRANFRENSAKIRKNQDFAAFFAFFKLLTRCTTSTSYNEPSTVRKLSSSAFQRCQARVRRCARRRFPAFWKCAKTRKIRKKLQFFLSKMNR